MSVAENIRQKMLVYQKNEITEYHIYNRLAARADSPENARVLKKIAADELQHYHDWKRYSGADVKPARLRILKYYLISLFFGYTFGIKLMERGEDSAQAEYEMLRDNIPEAAAIIRDENEHEERLIAMLDEERLRYTGSMVLGLNDALVELTGALAGLTLALQNTTLIALTGLITGIAAALSMGASEYLSTKAEASENSPVKAAIYTGIAYIITVAVLVMPYLLIDNYYICLGVTLLSAVFIIAAFNFYISVAKDQPFRSRFLEMAGLSLGVALVSFFIGYLVRAVLGVDV